ncbi:Uncharacterized protein QTN25_003459 [Entamoeba marina]
MSSGNWISNNIHSKWSSDVLAQYLGLKSGKVEGVVDRCLCHENYKIRCELFRILRNQIDVIDNKNVAELMFQLVVTGLLDRSNDVVKEALIVFKLSMKQTLYSEVVNETGWFVLLALLLNEVKEIRVHTYEILKCHPPPSAQICLLLNRCAEIYNGKQTEEKAMILELVGLAGRKFNDKFDVLYSLINPFPLNIVTTSLELLTSIYLLNIPNCVVAATHLGINVMLKLNELSPILCPFPNLQTHNITTKCCYPIITFFENNSYLD